MKVAMNPRVGFIGYGAIAAEHAQALAAEGCELAAVAGPRLESAREFAVAHAIPEVTTDIDELLQARDIDAVVIASPSDAHAPQAIAALEAGKHVLCEVPMATSAADAEAVLEAERRASSRSRLMICQTQRFWPPAALLRSRISAGEYDIHHLTSRTGIARRTNVGWTGRARSWVDSIIWHHGAHAVDMALWLLDGRVKEFNVQPGRLSREGRPMDIGISFVTDSSALATLVLSYNALSTISDLVVFAEQDTIVLRDGVLSGTRDTLLNSGSLAAMTDDAVRLQDREFARALRDASFVPSPSGAEVADAYRLLGQVDARIARGATQRD